MTILTGKPIIIADYDPVWPRRFEAERDLIFATCTESSFLAFEHMGSTAIPGLAAKPIIDIMPGLRSIDDAPPLIPLLERIGYEYVPAFERPSDIDEGMPFRRYFRKDLNGARAFQLHMVEVGSQFWLDHLLFRDWLRSHADDALAYERVKREIAERYNANLSDQSEINRGYTDHKSPFIAAVMAKAARPE
jgi:GrpB-like predicted nucleotidyltransferase (UPF0157 family)